MSGNRSADEKLIARIRPIAKRLNVSTATERKPVVMQCTEKKMFGGVCFMVNGNMCVGSWKGSLIVRLDRDSHEETQAEPHVQPMDITGKVMRGWARVEPAGITDDGDLREWVKRSARFVATLPAK